MITWPVSRVELAGRLVGQEEPRPVGERPGDGHALLLAARELVRPVPRPLAEADELEQLAHPRVALARLGADEAERDLDVLGRGQERHEPERLEDERDRSGAGRRRARPRPSPRLLAVDDDATATSAGRARRAG